ncbi:hypothetical protein STVA_03640 [Allostella vacuolata]|nr:hypothetical protein STVA_03640 [Stella vacuolata]
MPPGDAVVRVSDFGQLGFCAKAVPLAAARARIDSAIRFTGMSSLSVDGAIRTGVSSYGRRNLRSNGSILPSLLAARPDRGKRVIQSWASRPP